MTVAAESSTTIAPESFDLAIKFLVDKILSATTKDHTLKKNGHAPTQITFTSEQLSLITKQLGALHIGHAQRISALTAIQKAILDVKPEMLIQFRFVVERNPQAGRLLGCYIYEGSLRYELVITREGNVNIHALTGAHVHHRAS